MLYYCKGPNFIIPGFPKGGTTWLYNRLVDSSLFSMPAQKEIHFFNRDKNYNLGSSGKENGYFLQRKSLLRNFGYEGLYFFREYLKLWEANDDTYLRLFSNTDLASGDITPIYVLLGEEGIKRMSAKLNGVKILFILRDPIERSWSQFRMTAGRNKKPIDRYTLEEIKSFFNQPLQIKRSDYKRGIELFSKHFSKSPIAVIFYDTLLKNPNLFLESAIGFITGVSSDNSSVNLSSKDHVSTKIKMPDEVYKFLKEHLCHQYDWLETTIPHYGEKWKSRHYSFDETCENSQNEISIYFINK